MVIVARDINYNVPAMHAQPASETSRENNGGLVRPQ